MSSKSFPMVGLTEDYCERCGAFAEGRRTWMFHAGGSTGEQFYCLHCLRIMQIFAGIAFTLLGVVVLAMIAGVVWATIVLQ